MTIEAEQIDQLLETLRRDCLPAGGADLIIAYVSTQRQVLAQIQAELPDLRANMTKALDLLQVLTSTKYTDAPFVKAVDEADEMLEQLRGKVLLRGQADQQEVQGEEAGDEREAFSSWAHEKGFCLDCAFFEGGNNFVDPDTRLAYEIWMARADLFTQPAAQVAEHELIGYMDPSALLGLLAGSDTTTTICSAIPSLIQPVPTPPENWAVPIYAIRRQGE